ncbi:MAG: hypothetical protein M1833_002038 [Piccolia ochrophora]|nr:MAG: hypothetical protein M1833_002038 [Piccolia ochrophora]
MTPPLSTPPRRATSRRNDAVTPTRKSSRQPTITDALVDVLLPRSVTQPRPPKDKVEDGPDRSPAIQRARTRPKRQTIDLGTPLAPYDSNSVRDRVQQWQSQVGGVVERFGSPLYPPEATTVVSDESPRTSEMQSSRRTKRCNRLAAAEPEEIGSRSRKAKRRAEDEIENTSRSRSVQSVETPKRRVVSDGHWVKKSPPKSKATPGDTTAPIELEKLRVDGGVRVGPCQDGSMRERRREDYARTLDGMSIDDGHTQARVSSRQPRDDGDSLGRSKKPFRSKTVAEAEGDKTSPRTSLTPPQKLRSRRMTSQEGPPMMSGALASEDVDGQTRSRDQRRTDSPRSAKSTYTMDSEERVKARLPRKISMLREVYDEGKKIFRKEFEAPPAVQGNRIEAWLDSTSDPFVDEGRSTAEGAPQNPENVSSGHTSIAPPLTAANDDPRNMPPLDIDEASRHQETRRRRKQRRSTRSEDDEEHSGTRCRSPKPDLGTQQDAAAQEIVEDPHSPTSSPLKRTGARRRNTPSSRQRRGSTPTRERKVEDLTCGSLSELPPTYGQGTEPVAKPATSSQPVFKRPFPSTGAHPLSTIASVETFDTSMRSRSQSTDTETNRDSKLPNSVSHNETAEEGSAVTTTTDLSRAPSKKTSLKRKLTTHADLISVLSLPQAGNKSIRSARSLRTNRSRATTATITDLMQDLEVDETKFMRELRTLVDGVIPVLLSCVLSKADSAIAAGLFSASSNPHDDPSVTRPIVDMGIALERLKSLHKRIPQSNPDRLLRWAQGAQRVYSEYLKCWRMGFQDVVVNLAPTNDEKALPRETENPTDDVLPRNAEGDLIDGDGERVDVAFLLKRPLVRLKYLAKTLKGINQCQPSLVAEEQVTRFESLVVDARRRSNEERGRLEDERAANVDSTRARDPRTLAPLTGVSVDRFRRVKARDGFDLDFQHSSGQKIDCRIELLLREDPPDRGVGGDLLVCEVDETGRWLLFPPLPSGRFSARNGDVKGEIIIMITVLHGDTQQWHELLSLHTDDEQTGFEWVQLLGLTPVPPALNRSLSFISRQPRQKHVDAPSTPPVAASSTATKSRTPSPREVEIPIGEQARRPSATGTETLLSASPSMLETPHWRDHKDGTASTRSAHKDSNERARSSHSIHQHEEAQREPLTPTRSLNDAMMQAGSGAGSGLRRTKAKRLSRHADDSGTSPSSPKSSRYHDDQVQSPGTKSAVSDGAATRWSASESDPATPKALFWRDPEYPRHESAVHLGDADTKAENHSARTKSPSMDLEGQSRPPNHRRASSVPSMELPTIPKLRKSTPPGSMSPPPQDTNRGTERSVTAPKTLTKLQPRTVRTATQVEEEPTPPTPPPHRSPSPIQIKGSNAPKLVRPTHTSKAANRRSSSPLKHEYAPSSVDPASSSDASDTEMEDAGTFSDSSEEEELEDGDAPTPLLPWGALRRLSRVSPKESLYSLPNGTLTPSQSASQAPYKTVPPQPMQASRAIASIFSWSDEGFWKSLHPDECSIVITPGLIEAFEMSAAHSQTHGVGDNHTPEPVAPSCEGGEAPLVGLELTPLVPLRRGTALDISIRSPPTPRSIITSGNNIMFRSRSPEECEALYAMLNTSRINNPTYIALQNARGPYGSSYNSGIDRRSSSRGSSWWGWGMSRSRNSYRASANAAPSTAFTESSVGSLASTFSALKRFGNGGRLFNISKSTVTSRAGSRSDSIYSSSSSLSSFANKSGGTCTPPSTAPSKGSGGPAIGLSNAKIRLYYRESAAKWRDMGSARLSISLPPAGFVKYGSSGTERRVLVHGKTAGEILLDVCLEESAFERVARTGIALSVWEEEAGPNGDQVGAVGGVGAKTRVYMIQMKSEAETAYTFSMVGKLRY